MKKLNTVSTPNLLHWLAAAAVALAVALNATPAAAAKAEIYTGFLSSEAIGGYDAVAYFTDGEPVKGSDAFKTEWKGVTWKFSSAENLEAFEEDPEAYAPQYGGYCAWAVSQGYTAKGDPKYWAVRDGKLYLNYNKDVQDTWSTDPDGFIALADQNWPGVLD